MILEEETYEKFGYYPKELTLCSHKKILVACDDCGKIRILKREDYRSFCKSCVKRGKQFSEEHKKRIGEANSGKHRSEETKKILRKIRHHRKYPTHHTKTERIFEAICKKHNLPFKYTGDGTFWIKNINPDFVECNGKKIAVEVFGDYWHSPLLNHKLREDRTLHYRKKILKKYGWKLIVLWELDLKRKDVEAFVLNKLKKIIGST